MKATKTIFFSLLFFAFIFPTSQANAQSPVKKTDTFKVYGNCGMCKETIEGSLKKKDGVEKKEWNVKTKMMTVTYDPAKISLEQIKQKIAGSGYDTDGSTAKDETYNKLHDCCKYERPKNKS